LKIETTTVKLYHCRQIFKKMPSCTLALLTILAAITADNGALAEKRTYSGKINLTAPAIKSLHSVNKQLPGPTVEVPDLAENMNQCAGTVQHYRLPASGYLPPPQSEASQQGKILYAENNCASCHQAEGKGGTLGPPLDGIGGARGEQFITAHILNPEKQMLEFPTLFGGRSNIMPHPGLELKEAKLISTYLLTLADPDEGFIVVTHPKMFASAPKKQSAHSDATTISAESIKRGRELYLNRGCAACHTVDSAPSRFGPRLDGIATRRTRLDIEEALRGGNDEPEMIRTLHLSRAELQNIVDFLYSLPDGKPAQKKITPRSKSVTRR